MVKTGLSEEDGSWKIIAMSLPRIVSISLSGNVSRFLSQKTISPLVICAERGNRAYIRKPGHGFAAAGLADQTEYLASAYVKGNAGQGFRQCAALGLEFEREVGDGEEGGHNNLDKLKFVLPVLPRVKDIAQGIAQ